MKAIKEIERLVGIFCAVDKSSTSTSPQMDQRVLADALRAGKKPTTSKPAWAVTNMRRIIMKSPLTKLAIAAVVLLACGIGLSLWRTTGSGIALADVLARVEKVKAVRYKWTNEIAHHIDPDKPYHVEIRATSLNSREYGTKSNQEWLDPNGGESTFAEEYFLPQKKMTIGIVPKQKKYTRKEWDDGWVERMQKANPDIKDPLAFLKGILKYKYESLGRSTMDGIEVEGFRTTDPNHWGGKNPQVDIKIWVDVKTRLPVRYDSLASEEVNQRGDKMRTHFVMHDFQWDVPVAAADFEPVIPGDYTGTVIKYPAHITEETAIQGLKVWVELLGKYPEKITRGDDTDTVLRLAEKSETPAALRLKEEIKGLTDEEIGNKLVDFLMPIRGLAMFYNTFDVLQSDKKDRAYYGKIVTPKDTDTVLMRWKVSDKEYRVIFGDLRAQTVTAEALAKLEKDLPK